MHEFGFSSSDPRSGIEQTALDVFPELRTELARLRSLSQVRTEETRNLAPTPSGNRRTPSTPTGPEQAEVTPDQLEMIFRKSHAKREQDDETRRVNA
jgi:hypothetical protein